MTHHGQKTSGFTALRPDEARPTRLAVSAGPFDVPAKRRGEGPALSEALITGLLVVYPVLATVAALAVGLSFAAPVA